MPTPKDSAAPTHLELVGAMLAKERQRDGSGYHPWITILGGGRLRPGSRRLGAGRDVAGVEHLHRAVCFSEVPLDLLDRLIAKRSLHGIGFRKGTLVAKEGAPVWYLDQDGAQSRVIEQQIAAATAGDVDPEDALWKLTPFVDQPGVYHGRPHRWEWEREWRVVGDMSFSPDEVAFLFLPEEDHDRARQFFADVELEHSGPAYLGAYIDPRWEMADIQAALASIPEAPEPSANARPWWV